MRAVSQMAYEIKKSIDLQQSQVIDEKVTSGALVGVSKAGSQFWRIGAAIHGRRTVYKRNKVSFLEKEPTRGSSRESKDLDMGVNGTRETLFD